MRSPRMVCVLSAAVVLAGCSNADTPATPPPVPPRSAPAPSSAPPPGSPASTGALKLGQTFKATVDEYTSVVTVLNHKPFDGGYAIEVRTCNRGSAMFNASPVPWRLSYGGGEQLVDVTIEGGGLPSPAFVERELQVGKCARGWIAFEAPASGKPDGAEYHAEGAPSGRWEW